MPLIEEETNPQIKVEVLRCVYSFDVLSSQKIRRDRCIDGGMNG